MKREYAAAAAGIKIQYDTWVKRARATHDWAEVRVVEQTALRISEEFHRIDPQFDQIDFMLACGIKR